MSYSQQFSITTAILAVGCALMHNQVGFYVIGGISLVCLFLGSFDRNK